MYRISLRVDANGELSYTVRAVFCGHFSCSITWGLYWRSGHAPRYLPWLLPFYVELLEVGVKGHHTFVSGSPGLGK